MRLSVMTLLVHDQDQALRFFVDRLGFVVSEDNRLGDYRWLLVSAPETPDVAITLKLAQSDSERALVGKQGGDAPLFGLSTDDCRRDFLAMKARGVTFEGEPRTMPYGTGVMLKDLYGNKMYLNEDPPRESGDTGTQR
jgi:catechol 2,3-dioxygenase-like lactoylglutathione lyase family enzyme